MSDKALEFEDFILDDYDFNLLTDWDLIDLWEWVEMDDFSDIIRRDQKAMAKKANSTPQTPQQSQQKQQPPPQPSFGQQSQAPSPQHPSSAQQTSANSAPHNYDDDDDDSEDDDFDVDFEEEDASPAPITPPADTHKTASLPSPTKHLSSASPSSIPMSEPQAPSSSPQHTENNDDDFDFDFDFDDDNEDAEENDSDFGFDDSLPSINSQKTIPPSPSPATQKQAESLSPKTQTKASAPTSPQLPSPPPVSHNYQETQDDEEDNDFDFNFDDEEDSDTTDFDFNFDEDDEDDDSEEEEGDDDSEEEGDDDFDFSFDDDEEKEEEDYDFDFTDEDAGGIGSGGFSKKQPQEPHENRFIQTSVGVLDAQSDDILERLQELEFDEFLKVLQENPHVYNKILKTGNWSEEEMEFLQSIEPLVRNPKKLQEARDKKNDSSSPASPSSEQKPKSKFDTRIYQNAEEMYKHLCLKATELSGTKQQQKVKYLPDNLAQQWNKDSEEKQAYRVSHHLGTTLKVAPKPTPPPMQELTAPQGTTARPLAYLGINEAKFNEINHIFLHELYAMSQSLTPEALTYVRADGIRFGTEFITFLMNKYGSKILFLYRTQIKNDILSHKIFATHLSYITAHLQPENPEYYTMGFFKSIVDIIDKSGLNI